MPSARYPLLELLKVEQKHVAAIKAALSASAKQLGEDLSSMAVEGKLSRKQAEATRAAVQAQLDQDFSDVQAAIQKGRIEAAKSASAVISTYEDVLLKTVMGERQMQNVMESLAAQAASGLDRALQRIGGSSYKPLSKQIYDTQKLASGWVDEKINAALVSNYSAKRLAKEIAASFNPNVPGGVSYAAMRTARTEINNAAHASAAQRYANSNLVEGVEWHLSTSHPEGDICDSLAADSPYEPRSVPQKPHPHCYCFLTPALPDEDKFLENLFAGKYDEEPFASNLDPKLVNRQAEIFAPAKSTVLKGEPIQLIPENQAAIQERYSGLKTWLRETGQPDPASRGDALKAVYQYSGYDKTLPTVKKSISPESAIYRGLASSPGKTSAEMVSEFKNSVHYVSYDHNTYGSGSYFFDTQAGAEGYSGDDGSIIKAALQPGARVMDLGTISQLHVSKLNQRAMELMDLQGLGRNTEDVLLQNMDIGSFAALLGYDAVTLFASSPKSSYTIVLNRAALFVS